VLVGAATLTIGLLELFPNFGTISLEAENGASVDIQSLYDPSNQSTVVADAGGAIDYEALGLGTQINSGIDIAGDAGGVAGGVVTIASGYAIATSITPPIGAVSPRSRQRRSHAGRRRHGRQARRLERHYFDRRDRFDAYRLELRLFELFLRLMQVPGDHLGLSKERIPHPMKGHATGQIMRCRHSQRLPRLTT